jgi:hypothetical protein
MAWMKHRAGCEIPPRHPQEMSGFDEAAKKSCKLLNYIEKTTVLQAV